MSYAPPRPASRPNASHTPGPVTAPGPGRDSESPSLASHCPPPPPGRRFRPGGPARPRPLFGPGRARVPVPRPAGRRGTLDAVQTSLPPGRRPRRATPSPSAGRQPAAGRQAGLRARNRPAGRGRPSCRWQRFSGPLLPPFGMTRTAAAAGGDRSRLRIRRPLRRRPARRRPERLRRRHFWCFSSSHPAAARARAPRALPGTDHQCCPGLSGSSLSYQAIQPGWLGKDLDCPDSDRRRTPSRTVTVVSVPRPAARSPGLSREPVRPSRIRVRRRAQPAGPCHSMHDCSQSRRQTRTVPGRRGRRGSYSLARAV